MGTARGGISRRGRGAWVISRRDLDLSKWARDRAEITHAYRRLRSFCRASHPCPFDFSPNHRFWGGAALVIVSIFLYAWAPKASPYVAVADAGGPK